jgi:hypothetical protein
MGKHSVAAALARVTGTVELPLSAATGCLRADGTRARGSLCARWHVESNRVRGNGQTVEVRVRARSPPHRAAKARVLENPLLFMSPCRPVHAVDG